MKRVARSSCTCIFLVSSIITCGCQALSPGTLTTTIISTITISPVPPVTLTVTPIPEIIFPPPVTNATPSTVIVYPPPATVYCSPTTVTATYTLLAPAQTVTITQTQSPITVFTTQTSSTVGPDVFLIDSLYGIRNIQIEAGKILHFSFVTTGSNVRYWVLDPAGNPVYIGSGADFVDSGGGTFLAIAGGSYQFVFGTSSLSGPAIITLYYWIS
jgi:hypothetical protein